MISKINSLKKMIKEDKGYMIQDLISIKDSLDQDAETDVRLCIDFDSHNQASWIIRDGDASYDQRHSFLCGANSVHKSGDVSATLDELVDQVIDQCFEMS